MQNYLALDFARCRNWCRKTSGQISTNKSARSAAQQNRYLFDAYLTEAIEVDVIACVTAGRLCRRYRWNAEEAGIHSGRPRPARCRCIHFRLKPLLNWNARPWRLPESTSPVANHLMNVAVRHQGQRSSFLKSMPLTSRTVSRSSPDGRHPDCEGRESPQSWPVKAWKRPPAPMAASRRPRPHIAVRKLMIPVRPSRARRYAARTKDALSGQSNGTDYDYAGLAGSASKRRR